MSFVSFSRSHICTWFPNSFDLLILYKDEFLKMILLDKVSLSALLRQTKEPGGHVLQKSRKP